MVMSGGPSGGGESYTIENQLVVTGLQGYLSAMQQANQQTQALLASITQLRSAQQGLGGTPSVGSVSVGSAATTTVGTVRVGAGLPATGSLPGVGSAARIPSPSANPAAYQATVQQVAQARAVMAQFRADVAAVNKQPISLAVRGLDTVKDAATSMKSMVSSMSSMAGIGAAGIAAATAQLTRLAATAQTVQAVMGNIGGPGGAQSAAGIRTYANNQPIDSQAIQQAGLMLARAGAVNGTGTRNVQSELQGITAASVALGLGPSGVQQMAGLFQQVSSVGYQRFTGSEAQTLQGMGIDVYGMLAQYRNQAHPGEMGQPWTAESMKRFLQEPGVALPGQETTQYLTQLMQQRYGGGAQNVANTSAGQAQMLWNQLTSVTDNLGPFGTTTGGLANLIAAPFLWKAGTSAAGRMFGRGRTAAGPVATTTASEAAAIAGRGMPSLSAEQLSNVRSYVQMGWPAELAEMAATGQIAPQDAVRAAGYMNGKMIYNGSRQALSLSEALQAVGVSPSGPAAAVPMAESAAVRTSGVGAAVEAAAPTLSEDAGLLSRLGGGLRGAGGLVGPALGVALTAYDVYNAYRSDQAGTTQGATGHAALAGVGGLSGGLAGAWAGAEGGALAGGAIGALFGGVGAVPGALIGGAVGGIAGGFGGGWFGNQLGNTAADAFFGPATNPAQAAAVPAALQAQAQQLPTLVDQTDDLTRNFGALNDTVKALRNTMGTPANWSGGSTGGGGGGGGGSGSMAAFRGGAAPGMALMSYGGGGVSISGMNINVTVSSASDPASVSAMVQQAVPQMMEQFAAQLERVGQTTPSVLSLA